MPGGKLRQNLYWVNHVDAYVFTGQNVDYWIEFAQEAFPTFAHPIQPRDPLVGNRHEFHEPEPVGHGGEDKVLGAHMLEICESIAAGKPRLDVLPLSIGGKADPVRLIFDSNTGPAVCASIMDMGQRFRLVVNIVDVVPTDEPLPKLPVARALWLPRPNLKAAAAAWIYAGGAHHTGFSYAVSAEHLRDFAEMAGIEFLLIDENTKLADFKKELRWNDLYYHMVNGL